MSTETCQICLSKQSEVLECKHSHCCQSCLNKLYFVYRSNRCPVCRSPFQTPKLTKGQKRKLICEIEAQIASAEDTDDEIMKYNTYFENVGVVIQNVRKLYREAKMRLDLGLTISDGKNDAMLPQTDSKGVYYQTTLEARCGNANNSLVVIFCVPASIIPQIISLEGYRSSSSFIELNRASNLYSVVIDKVANDKIRPLLNELTPIINHDLDYSQAVS